MSLITGVSPIFAKFNRAIACPCGAELHARAPEPFAECPQCHKRYALNWDGMTHHAPDDGPEPAPAAPPAAGDLQP